ncbi:uncharacterized protein LOC142579779 isoform X2 [Dermacentor variabilis]|uniref:uncharacterized protein LOC142579779 isoform X2 n=1 Tax=Dermacentor variabilis TaxID=34621 RepID=UPI003F5C1A0E
MADDAYGSVAMRVLLDGIEKAVFPVTENGCHVQYDGAFLYETEDGLHIAIRNKAAPVSSPLAAAAGFDVASQAMPPTATPSMATLPPTATPPPLSADSEREVWNTNKSKFLISKYKEFKEVIGKKGGFRTKKAMWEKLAQEINQEFQCHMTPLQVENKWKSMERAYKKTKIKNSSSGHSRAACEYEGELSEVLEREHHITPVALLAPGRIVANRNGEHILPENGPADDPAEEAPAEEAPAEELQAPRRSEVEVRRGRGGGRHRGSSIGSLISVLQEAIAAKQKQHDEKMALLERLVRAAEGNK